MRNMPGDDRGIVAGKEVEMSGTQIWKYMQGSNHAIASTYFTIYKERT